ncbi:NYN domain-containing protein [Seohaeicola zhoushanensis]|uniref:NYN domain-containing protein n=1 Tax=Seohaeicola zhoushanensis TaxID=1569283 RepID=A0A8J3H1W1_9RHOB|nr:NYN domain-containing protein [Seohaeicola zhoushanensis]GHF66001.1 hypothetical protein GCM10017056_41540 [Seohaeicola zhoushanensis]
MNAATGFARIRQDLAVAVLVDGENICADHAGQIGKAAEALGPVGVRRVYGNVARLAAWEAIAGFTPVHVAAAKNSADLRLTVDAMDLFLRAGYRHFLLASSDGDFTHLATYLRDNGAHVAGLGAERASLAFRAACHAFTTCDAAPLPVAPQTARSRTEKRVVAMLRAAGDSGLCLSQIGHRMLNEHGTSSSSLPERSWHGYLAARPHLFRCDPRGSTARVRL